MIDLIEPNEKFYELFEKAGKVNIAKYLTEAERKEKKRLNGAKAFKRKLLGFFGYDKVKSLDEIASVLKNIGAVSTVDEGKHIVPLFAAEKRVYYADNSANPIDQTCQYFEFEEVMNNAGQKKYRVRDTGHCFDMS